MSSHARTARVLTALVCSAALIVPAAAAAHGFRTSGAGKSATFASTMSPEINGGVIECKKTTYAWTLNGAAASISLTPAYSGCEISSDKKATVTATATGCGIELEKVTEPNPNEFKAGTKIAAGCVIKYKILFSFEKGEFECRVTLEGTQSSATGVEGKDLNMSSPFELEMSQVFNHVKYTASPACEGVKFVGKEGLYASANFFKMPGVKFE